MPLPEVNHGYISREVQPSKHRELVDKICDAYDEIFFRLGNLALEEIRKRAKDE